MKVLTKSELDALHKVRANKSAKQIGDLVGLTRQRITDLLKADAGIQIENPTWKKLESLIKPYLSDIKPVNISGQDHLPLTEMETTLLDYFRKFSTDEKVKCLNCMREHKFCGEDASRYTSVSSGAEKRETSRLSHAKSA